MISESSFYLGKLEKLKRQTAATTPVSPLWQPREKNKPQTAGYECEADELFFGGAAGGGKSDLILGLGITAQRRSIILRRRFTQLRTLIDRSKDIIGQSGDLNESLYVWRNLPGDRQIEFGAVNKKGDEEKYRGRPHDFIGFDELPEFTERQYRFLVAWLRTTIPGQRVRVVGTGNPPSTDDGYWVVKYWAPWLDEHHPNPAVPGELRWFARVEDKDIEVDGPEPFKDHGELVSPRSRTFIPSRLEDNPDLSHTEYAAILRNLFEPMRSQLLYGDFTIGAEPNQWQVIPTDWVRMAQQRWTPEPPNVPLSALGCDPARGGKDQTVLVERYENYIAALQKYAGKDTDDGPKVAALVMSILKGKEAHVNLDPIGIGSSPLDALEANDIDVHPINFSERSSARDRTGKFGFRNKRAEAYWKMREALDPDHGANVALPKDQELLADLTAPRWKLTISGIQIEDKAEIAERLERSPDCGDAVVLAFFGAEAGSAEMAGESRPSRWHETQDIRQHPAVEDEETGWSSTTGHRRFGGDRGPGSRFRH